MKRLLFFYITFGLSAFGILPAEAQDVSINVLANSATLPLNTTGSIQVDVCNTDPSSSVIPANKLNPQITVGSNVTVLGVTNVDGSPLTNFAILSNNGQTVSLVNTSSLPNPNCFSFKVIVRGATIDLPGAIGSITAAMNFQDSPTAGNQTFNDNSATSVSVIQPKFDLSPVLYVYPSVTYGSKPIDLVVDIVELNSIPTDGVITVKVSRDPMLNLSFDAAASSIAGRSVQNSAWDFDNSSSGYYVLTSKQALKAGGLLSFGLNGMMNPNGTTGILTISSVIVSNGNEQRVNNNIMATKINYFRQ